MNRLTHKNGLCRCDNGQECTPDDNCTEECIQERIDRLAAYEDFAEDVTANPQRYGPYTVGAVRRILREYGGEAHGTD